MSMVCRLRHRFLITAMPLESIDKVKYTINHFMAFLSELFFLFFLPRVFILSTIIAYGMYITNNVLYHRYDPGNND